ncbi:MAG: lysophospholipase [Sphingomonadales bacterium]|jgi:lysophospholipase|nr:lysophospholipase [Sphingomonadales bacterium]
MPFTPFDRRSVPAAAAFSTWAAPDNWPYRLLRWPQEAGRTVRGSLLFAGGRGDFIEKYLEADAHWQERGWDVTALDWRGQGGSRGKIVGGHVDSFDPLVDDLAALIDDWRSRTPEPHVAIGHSMGGHLLLRTLAERKPGLDAAVLVAPMIRINSGALPAWAAAWTATAMSAVGLASHPAWQHSAVPTPAGSFRQSILTGCPERYEDELWWWRKEPGYNLGAPSWGWLRAAFASCDRLTPARLRAVALPVLLLGTDRDRLVSPAAIREAAALIPKAELVMLAEAGHEILREADPIRLAALARIDAFFDARAG